MPNEPLYTLDRASIEVLRRMVHAEMRRVKSELGQQFPPPRMPQGRIYYGKVTTQITAASGTTPGTGVVALTWFDEVSGSTLELITDATNTISVRNMWDTIAIPVNQYVQVIQDTAGTFWVASEYVYQPLIRFTLAAALTTADASKTGTITNQYGPGIASPNTGAGAITVHNYETKTAGTYRFEGDVGDAGEAIWDSGTNYRIIDLCPV